MRELPAAVDALSFERLHSSFCGNCDFYEKDRLLILRVSDDLLRDVTTVYMRVLVVSLPTFYAYPSVFQAYVPS